MARQVGTAREVGTARDIGTAGVVGLGTMGAGVVEVMARAGLDVVAADVDAPAVEAGRRRLEASLERAVRRGRLEAGRRDAVLARVRLTTALEDLAGCDVVVEAVPEQLGLKTDVLTRLDALLPPAALLATNTSSLPVTRLAAATAHPGRVVGMHFFNPAPVLALVEVVRTVLTEDDVVADVVALAERLGKRPVVVADRAGFLANALLFGYLNEAVTLLDTGRVGREDLDAAMALGVGLPLGPLALLDLVGLDVALAVLTTLHDETRDRRHAPAPLLTRLVDAGRTGRKSGRGFWTYAAPGSGEVVPDGEGPAAGAAGAQERVDDGAPELRTAVVVGDGRYAAEVAGVLAAAGLAVTRVDDRPDPAGPDAAGLAGDETGTADLVVEAAADPAAAGALLARLGAAARPGAVLATTSEHGPVVARAAASGRARDVVGLFPADRRAVPGAAPGPIEVVRTAVAAPSAVAAVAAAVRRAGWHAVICADRAGRVVDALLVPHLNDAVAMVGRGYASADDVDTAMTAGCGYPAGPFALLDAMGTARALAVQRLLHAETGEPGHAPAPLLLQLVAAGDVAPGRDRRGAG